MALSIEGIEVLAHPAHPGVIRIAGFLGNNMLARCQAELDDGERLAWRDNHTVHTNARGLEVTQNFDVYALKLSRGDQSPLDAIPNISEAAGRIARFIGSLESVLPRLKGWSPDELTLHRYDDPEVGLSFHRDNLRFTRLITVLSLEGVCSLAVRSLLQSRLLACEPGDLMLIRGPGLIEDEDASKDLRPEHAVVSLSTPTRTSMTLRENSRPGERIPGFTFDNW